MLVKTWLLIACGTGFYAIIFISVVANSGSVASVESSNQFVQDVTHITFGGTVNVEVVTFVICTQIMPFLPYCIYCMTA